MSKVVVAMSGGVDSSVAALLLKRAGYEVVGVFMRHGIGAGEESEVRSQKSKGMENAETPKRRNAEIQNSEFKIQNSFRQGCCSVEDAADAARVARQLDIPFYVLNFQEAFTDLVDHFVAEYAAGRTPNPCIRCNQDIKFGRLWEYARAIGAEDIATGHYARIQRNPEGEIPESEVRSQKSGDSRKNERPNDESPAGPADSSCFLPHSASRVSSPALLRGVDPKKDQSYVLFGLSREILKHVLFPVGDYHKADIRKIARDAGLTVGAKPDSYEICFVPDHDHARLLRARQAALFQPGDIVDTAGRRLGRHEGLPGYTIGQRHGLKVAVGEPVYVLELRMDTNTLVVGRRNELLRPNLSARGATWLVEIVNPEAPEHRNDETDPQLPSTQNSEFRIQNSFRARCQIRYHHQAAPGVVTVLGTDRFTFSFDEPQAAVTPGQAAVLYDETTGQQVLGGGWIE